MEDLIDELVRANSPTEAVTTFLDSLAGLDIVNLSFRVLVDGRHAAGFSTSPQAWRDHYFAESFEVIDPSVLNALGPNRVTLCSFDPQSPHYDGSGRLGELFDGVRDAVGNGAHCSYFKASSHTSIVSLFTGVPGSQLESWAKSNAARLSLMAAAFNFRMQELIDTDQILSRTHYTLTDRERDCVLYLAQGLRVSAIAHRMSVSERTVEFHITNARKKLRAPTRESLVAQVLLA